MKRRVHLSVSFDFEDENELIDTTMLTKDIDEAIDQAICDGLVLDVERRAYILAHNVIFLSNVPIADKESA